MSPLIYAWPGYESLAQSLATQTGGETAQLSLRHFPDGETYVRLATPPTHRDVILACGLQRPDEKVCSLLFAADAARDLGARRVGLVAPYLAYMRQDARFNPGEAIASRSFARLLAQTVDWLVTMDPHLHRHRTLDEIYSIPTAIASSTAPIAQWIAANVTQPLIIGPDAESAQWAEAIAARLDCPWVVLAKERHGDRDVEVSLPEIDAWPGRTPVLVDDIISTARTMAAAARRLHELRTSPPVCIGVHALFGEDASDTLANAGVQAIATCNTIRHETNAIDVFGEIAATTTRLYERLP